MRQGDALSLPKGWEIKRLEEVCNFQNGFSFQSKFYKESGLPILRITNIQNNEIEMKDLVYFDTKDYKVNLDRFRVFHGDLLIAMSGATTGKLGINNCESIFYLNQRVGKFIPKKETNKTYLYYFLTTKLEESLRIAIGAAQPNLSTEQINNFIIPFPPLPEQHRIVAILDKTFAALGQAKAKTEQNLKNAKELFESYLQGVFENGNWEEKNLEEICFLISKGSSPKWQGINYVDKPGVLFVTSENVGENALLLEKRKYVEEKFNISDKKSILKNGDVLTNIVGASIGRTAIFNMDDVANINQAVCLIRCNHDLLFNEYLMYLLNSPFTKQHLHDNEVNNARANLSLGFFRSLSIPLPELTEQIKVVEKIKEFHIETQKLEAIYQKKLLALEELKKSVLAKAFAGEL
jgi:type I restriction enzyme S subunit